MTRVGKSKRFKVGWGRKDGRIAFFISHAELPENVVCDPKDLPKKMVKLANKIDRKRAKKKRV